MNLVSRLLTLGTLMLSSAAFAADPFTGKITMAMSSSKEKPMVMIYSIKPDASRIDLQGQPMSMIYNLPNKEFLMLMHEQKMYMSKTIDPADIPVKEGKGDNSPDIEDTGKTEVICGYTCHQFLVKDGNNVTEMWLAEGLGAYMGAGSPGGGGGGMFGKKQNSATAAKWEKALKGKGGFPLRVVTHDKAGKDVYKMEATKVEKGGVSDADFVAPKDYQKFQMPSLGDLNPFKRS